MMTTKMINMVLGGIVIEWHTWFFNSRYLTGNPCTEYEGYRQYVIATLPQLQVW